jgi:hypothetical protein
VRLALPLDSVLVEDARDLALDRMRKPRCDLALLH